MQTTTTTFVPTQRGTDTPTPISARPPARLVDPEQLICPGCGEQVRCAPPHWRMTDGLPVPQFSHQDATALCRTVGGFVAEPIEVA